MTSSTHGPLEDETCRRFVLPALTERAGWHADRIRRAHPVSKGRIRANALRYRQDRPVIADYVLDHSDGVPVAVIEAKRSRPDPADGIEPARQRAEMLDVPFAYSTNGVRIIELDRHTGRTTEIAEFPTPRELWNRYKTARGLAGEVQDRITSAPLGPAPWNWDETPRIPRYYQEIAINRTVQSIARGKKRILLTLATGTGKTFVAAQIAAKLCNSDWPRGRKPRVLYLADRTILLEQARDGDFRPVFGAAVHTIGDGSGTADQHVYLGLCQPRAGAGGADSVNGQFGRDFFDLVIVEECHGGSTARDAGWPEILERFPSAVHVGLTSTPLTRKDAEIYRHFGEPLYEYSLARGIADGFLAPYRVRKVRLNLDSEQPKPAESGPAGIEIPDGLYGSWEHARLLATLDRVEEAARYITDYMYRSGRLNKTLIVCQDPGHASRVADALSSANADLVGRYGRDYACRITSADGSRGRDRLERFRDAGSDVPAIAVTSDLLSAGIDIPALRNVVLYRVIRSMPEFKQIIGRGARLFPGDEKLAFDIIDFVDATRVFSDTRFDGQPIRLLRDETDRQGHITDTVSDMPPHAEHVAEGVFPYLEEPGGALPPAVGTDAVGTKRARHRLPADEQYIRAIRARVLGLKMGSRELLDRWARAETRKRLRAQFDEWPVDTDSLADWTGYREADVIDLLLFITWQYPLLTRAERAKRVKQRNEGFFASYSSPVEQALKSICDQYAARGPEALDEGVCAPDIMHSEPGGGPGQTELVGQGEFRDAVDKLGGLIYAMP